VGAHTLTAGYSPTDGVHTASTGSGATVTVNDTDLGTSSVPANITTDATSPASAVVT
jgi:hypothetical protein